MKECPFCKQSIEDEAEFCFYCMTSLYEKQEIPPTVSSRKGRWIACFVITAVVVAALILWWSVGRGSRSALPAGGENSVGETAAEPVFSAESHTATPSSKSEHASLVSSAPAQTVTMDSSVDSADSVDLSAPSSAASSEITSAPASSSATLSRPQSTMPSVPQDNQPVSSENTSSAESQEKGCIYAYRNAEKTDDFYSLSLDTEGSVVITGVKHADSDGVYEIPSTIDGKTVVAVMPLAFSSVSKTVEQIVIPASVKTVWNYAFEKCVNLTHVYLCGKAIYIESRAFEGAQTFTLHCSADCSDRNFRYYKNIAASYGAVYEEWNG